MFPVSFATPAQFFLRYDYRWVAKQILDNNSAASLAEMLNPNTVGGGIIATFIAEESEEVMSAAAVGDRYNTQTNPLLPPIANDLAIYGGQKLVGLVCDLVLGRVLKRRARAAKDDLALTMAYAEAKEKLEQLRQGERIFFMVPGVPEAGLPSTQNLAPPLGLGPALITDNPAIFGTIGFSRNYGLTGQGAGPGC
jgi:hypothetical protein